MFLLLGYIKKHWVWKISKSIYIEWVSKYIWGQDDILDKKKGVNVLQIQYNEKQKIPH